MRRELARFAGIFLTVGSVVGTSSASAQGGAVRSEPRIGIGYVVNAPNQFVGVSAHVLSTRLGGFGFYIDSKLDLDSPRDERGWIDSVTARDVETSFGDALYSSESSWTSVNAALMRSVTSELVLYLGAGYARGTQFRQYEDPERQRGFFGYYWVVDEEASGGRLNLLGGAFFQAGRNFALQFGVESQPGGVSVGAAYLLPIR